MPFVPCLNTAQVEIRALYFGEKVENTLWFQKGSAITAADLNALTEAVHDGWVGSALPLLPSGYQLTEVVATDFTTATSGVATFPATGSEVGAESSPGLPGNVSITISFRTANRGRSFRGRNYWVGLTEATVAANEVTSARIGEIISCYVAVVAVAEGEGWNHVIASRYSGVDSDGKPIPRANGVMTVVTTYIVVDTHVDSQRRRLSGRGQ